MPPLEEWGMPKANNPDRCLYEDPPGFWCIRLWDPTLKQRIRRRVGPKSLAKQVLNQLQNDIVRRKNGLPTDSKLTIEDLVDKYRDEWRATKRTSHDDDRHADYFLEAFGHRPARELSPGEIVEWRTAYMAGTVPSEECLNPVVERPKRQPQKPGPRKPSTANRALAFLRRLYNMAIRDGLLELNPAARVQALKENNMINAWLRPGDQEQHLRKHFRRPEDWRICELGIHTGLRASNLFSIRREHADLEQGFLRVPTTKTDRAQDLPLSERAVELLREMLAEHDSDWLLPSPTDPTHPRCYDSWRNKRFKPAVKRAGLTLRFHDLRHTFGSRLINQGAPDYEVAALMNHASTAMLKRYAHLAPDRLRRTVQLLDRDAKALSTEVLNEGTL